MLCYLCSHFVPSVDAKSSVAADQFHTSRYILGGVDVCFHPQGCGLKVVQGNIHARDSCALSTLRVISISNITTDNYWTILAAQSVC